MSREFVAVLITTAGVEEAEKLAKTLVDEGLAACVNIVAGCRSVYRWEGKIHTDDEALMVVKTAKERFDALATRVSALHSYDVPEIVAVELAKLSEGYRRFLEGTVD